MNKQKLIKSMRQLIYRVIVKWRARVMLAASGAPRALPGLLLISTTCAFPRRRDVIDKVPLDHSPLECLIGYITWFIASRATRFNVNF